MTGASEILRIPPPESEDRLAEHVARMIGLLGEDLEREGLRRTPSRVAESMRWLTDGYDRTATEVIGDAVFAESHDSMVMVRDIEYYSLCEHHLLPFFGRAHVAYVPNGRVIGLSKIPRVIDLCMMMRGVQ